MSNGFVEDFFLLLNKLKNNEPFAFVRFSDGETAIMQNEHLVLRSDHVRVGETVHDFGYSEDDHKEFDPEKHGFLREALIDSFKFKKKNYFVGAGCNKCTCAIKNDIPWLREMYLNGEEHWTSPNLFVNANYPLFVTQFVKEFKNHKIVIICSKNADLNEMPFEIVKDFRVGKNCIINDHHLIDEIKAWINKEDIKNHIFLFSASSLSEILIHKFFEYNEQNTYIDIGTCLHKYAKLGIERDYLKAFWLNTNHFDLFKSCG